MPVDSATWALMVANARYEVVAHRLGRGDEFSARPFLVRHLAGRPLPASERHYRIAFVVQQVAVWYDRLHYTRSAARMAGEPGAANRLGGSVCDVVGEAGGWSYWTVEGAWRRHRAEVLAPWNVDAFRPSPVVWFTDELR